MATTYQDLVGAEGFAEPDLTSSRSDVLTAAFLSGTDQTSISAFLGRGFQEGSFIRSLGEFFSDEPKLSPDELNKKYNADGALDKPFDSPMTEASAHEIRRRAMDKRAIDKTLRNADGSTLTKVASFAASMAPIMMDPIEMGIGLATGWGTMAMLGRYAHKAAWAASAAKKLQAPGLNLAKVSTNVGEGVVSNVIGEAAFISTAHNLDQKDYDLDQGIFNGIVGGITMPLAFAGVAKSFGLLRMGGERAFETMFSKAEAGINSKIPNDMSATAATYLKTEVGPHLSRSSQKMIDSSEKMRGGLSLSSMDKSDLDAILHQMRDSKLYDDMESDILRKGEISEAGIREAGERLAKSADEIERMPDDVRDILTDESLSPDNQKIREGLDEAAEEVKSIEATAKDAPDVIEVGKEFEENRAIVEETYKEDFDEADLKEIEEANEMISAANRDNEMWKAAERCVGSL